MARPKKPKTEVTVPGTEVNLSLKDLSVQIVTDLAAGLSDAKAVRERYGISLAQWEILKRNQHFRSMLQEALQRLKGDLNAGARIKHKADVLLEDNLPVLDQIANDREAQSMARIKAIETMASLAGRGAAAQKTEGGGAGAFNLQIVIGDREVTVKSDSPPPLEHNPDE